MLLANAKMLWRKVASKSLDRTRNDPCINWLNGLNCLVWQDITYILIHFLPNSHIWVIPALWTWHFAHKNQHFGINI